MATNVHSQLTGDEIHTPYIKTFANDLARTGDASTYTSSDLYKKALQLDTKAEYILTAVSPSPVWTAVSPSSGTLTFQDVLGVDNVTGGEDVIISNGDSVIGEDNPSGPGYNLRLRSGSGDVAGVKATATLTVASTPAAATITFTSAKTGVSVSLSPAGGPRASGSNNYDETLGTTAQIAADIAAAINDLSNDFGTFFDAAANSSDVDLTASFVGVEGNTISIVSDDPSITTSGLNPTGGVDPDRDGDILFSANTWSAITANTSANNRGRWSVDLQAKKDSKSDIASGQESVITGGRANKASGDFSIVTGGVSNKANGDYSVIVSGSSNVIGASSTHAIVLGGSTNEILGSEYSMASGFGNSINSTSDYSTIISGETNEIDSGIYSNILSGESNTISTSDYSNIISGQSNNIMGGNYSTILSGTSNEITSNQSVITNGSSNIVEGFIGRAGGVGSKSRNRGEDVYASHYFTEIGDAQRSEVTWLGTTTDDVPTKLYLNSTATSEFVIPINSAIKFTIEIVARVLDGGGTGATAGFKISGLARRNSGLGNGAIVGSLTIENTATEILSPLVISVSMDFGSDLTDNGILAPMVTGLVATNIRWVATMTSAFVMGE